MSKNRLLFVLVAAVLTASVSAAAFAKPPYPGGSGEFEVGLIGDIPYNALQEHRRLASSTSSTAKSSPS